MLSLWDEPAEFKLSLAALRAILRVVKLLLLSASDLVQALPMTAAVEASERAYRALSSGDSSAPLRTAVPGGEGGTVLLMGAAVGGSELAAKVVSVFPGNAERGEPTIGGLVIAFDPSTGSPLAVLPGAWLTAMRTGAASGIATRALARESAEVGLVLGAGPQARTQALAIDTVRELREIRIYARRPDAGRALAQELSSTLRAEVVFVESLRAAVAGAEIICTATSARDPLLTAEMLEPGMHINAVGSFRPEMCEFDVGVVSRARVFVDSVSACSEESGELIAAEAEGAKVRASWTELGALLEGSSSGRSNEEEITLFKSVGVAEQDACAAGEAIRRAVSMGLGTEADLS